VVEITTRWSGDVVAIHSHDQAKIGSRRSRDHIAIWS
jgi:hypothetical protein